MHLQTQRPEAVNQAHVFMIKSLTGKWRQPIAFYFSEDAGSGQDLLQLQKVSLESLISIRLELVAVICDQGSCNSTLYKQLGVTCEHP